jgi:hypothetical protein
LTLVENTKVLRGGFVEQLISLTLVGQQSVTKIISVIDVNVVHLKLELSMSFCSTTRHQSFWKHLQQAGLSYFGKTFLTCEMISAENGQYSLDKGKNLVIFMHK